MKQTITRYDGVEYERKTKEKKYDTRISFRMTQNDLDKLKEIAIRKEINYSDLARNVIHEYIRKELKKNVV